MAIEIPQALQRQDKDMAIDATYFVIRILRNVGRGYPATSVSTEPSREAHDLAERAVRQIEAHEKAPISDLDDDRLSEYIVSLEGLLRTTYLDAVGSDTKRAATILDEMRSSDQ